MTILTIRTGKKIHSLDGIEQLADWPIAQMVWELNLNNHHISDFNMEKLVTIFPRLKIVSLCNNNITTLRPEMIAGTVYMSDDANRSEISLMRNPITTIETECFDSVANLKEVHIYTSSPLADSLIKQIEKAIEKHEQQFKKEDNAVKRYIVKQAALIRAPLLAAALFSL